MLGVLPAGAVDPTTRYVSTSGSDPANDCTDQAAPCLTIQYAINQADEGDLVSVGAGTYAESVRARTSVTIQGAGADGADQTTISGHGSDPAVFVDGFDSNQRPSVTLRQLAVSGGGDGVLYDQATGLLDHVAVNDDAGAGLLVTAASAVTIRNSTVSGNGDDGVDVSDPESVVRIERSTLDGNAGTGVYVASDARAAVRADTVSNTRPPGSGSLTGPGVVVESGGTATIKRSTLYRNTGEGVAANGTATITHSTITRTRSAAVDPSLAGGLVQVGSSALTLSSTIVAHNATPDCAGTITDAGYNLSSDAGNSCGFSGANHSLTTTRPELSALADFGGPTRTQRPLAGSPAANVIPAGETGCLPGARDQRGVARPQPLGGACDIGAVERTRTPSVSLRFSPEPSQPGEPITATITLHGGAPMPGACSVTLRRTTGKQVAHVVLTTSRKVTVTVVQPKATATYVARYRGDHIYHGVVASRPVTHKVQ